MAVWVLVHSPLLGPASWGPVAGELRARARTAVLPDLTPALRAEGSHVRRQIEIVAAAVPGPGPAVLVGHSGAGPLLPLIARRLAQQGITVTAGIFVDAALPHPGRSRAEALPAPAAEQLRLLTIDGWLAPWTSWWTPDQLEALVSDAGLRNGLIAGAPRLPATLFTEVFPDTGGQWMDRCCYIRLSAAYDSCAKDAGRARWPVLRLDTGHLGLLTEPARITDSLLAVIAGAPDRA